MQTVLVDDGLHLRKPEHLVAQRLAILAQEARIALAALRRLALDHALDVLDRHERAHRALVARLTARLSAGRRFLLPLRAGRGAIGRRGLRRVVRGLAE